MKIRILMLLMSVFAVTPVLLGDAWAGYMRSNDSFRPESQECSKRHVKKIPELVKKDTKSQNQTGDALIAR